MSASPKPEPGTTIARVDETPKLPGKYDHVVAANKARNALVAQIRGTMWGKECSPESVRAVAQYCYEQNLDPVRHVELLGGRIYLTAELYDEKGAELLRSGVIVPEEPDYINSDTRLAELGKMGDAWAAAEELRRKRERIKWNAPEDAKAIVVQRFRIAASNQCVIGVNWCGQKSDKKDPVGNAEPSKTAQTRARRRAWKQIADVIPGYAAIVRPLEERARMLAPIATVEAPAGLLPMSRQPIVTNAGYDTEPSAERDEKGVPTPIDRTSHAPADEQRSVGDSEEELLAEDRALAEQEDGELSLGDQRPRGRRTAIED